MSISIQEKIGMLANPHIHPLLTICIAKPEIRVKFKKYINTILLLDDNLFNELFKHTRNKKFNISSQYKILIRLTYTMYNFIPPRS